MYIVNTTYHIDMRLKREFVAWLHTQGEAAAEASGLVSKSRIFQVLGGDDPEGISLAWQLEAPTLADARKWHDGGLVRLNNEATRTWGKKVLYFTTFLKDIEA